jgi:hypothetical protein
MARKSHADKIIVTTQPHKHCVEDIIFEDLVRSNLNIDLKLRIKALKLF